MQYKAAYSTAKARQRCLDHLKKACADHGASVEVCDILSDGKEIHCQVVKGPHRCQVTMDYICGLDAFLGHWHMDSQSDAKYPREFGAVIGSGSINTCHYRKATTCEYTWADFIRSITAGLAYLPIA